MTSIQNVRRSLAALTMASLAACGGGGDDGNPGGVSCRSLGAQLDGPNGSSACSGDCRVESLGSSVDGDFGSATKIRMVDRTTGTAAVSANPKGNGMFAAGTVLGVVYETETQARPGASYLLNTYLRNAPQDSFNLPATDVAAHFAATTTRPYDTVEVRYTQTSGEATGTVKVFEFCSD